MSQLLFNVDCRSLNSEGMNGRHTRQKEAVIGESWTPVSNTSASGQATNWRRKYKMRLSQKAGVQTPFECESRGNARAEPVQRIRTYGICCPTQFFSDEFEQKMEANRKHENQRWIFDLIKKPEATTEIVFRNRKEWMLVEGSKHEGVKYNGDIRYLVIFKDMKLKTIRDLRRKHLDLLREVEREVLCFLDEKKHRRADFKMYFHYLPSVFQLHLHVCSNSSVDSIRRQYLHCIIRNIEQNDTWYRDALILFAPPRGSRTQVTNTAANVQVGENLVRDKMDNLCI